MGLCRAAGVSGTRQKHGIWRLAFRGKGFGLRGGFVFKAHRLWHHSTLGLTVIKKKKSMVEGVVWSFNELVQGRRSLREAPDCSMRVEGLSLMGFGRGVHNLGFCVWGAGCSVHHSELKVGG